MNPRNQRRVMLLVALLVLGGAFGVLASGALTDNLVPYHDPTTVLAAGADAVGPTLRLGGQVGPDSVSFDDSSQVLSFIITDGTNNIPVRTSGVPPDMFREGIGAVVEGKLDAQGVFQGTRILVKHSNEYRAPEEGKHPGEIYETVEGL